MTGLPVRRRTAGVLACVAVTISGTLTGCSPAAEPPAAAPAASRTPATSPEPEPEQTRPARGSCYRLSLPEVLAPTSAAQSVPCRRRWTSRTIHVGPLAGVGADPMVSVESASAERLMAAECPRRLAAYLGGTSRQLRLTAFRAVWFTPTPAEVAGGADWFRCDLVVLATPDRLARLTGNLRGLLSDSERTAPYSLCGTAAPDVPGFERVACARDHAWRAVGSVDLDSAAYPGTPKARRSAERRCIEEARRMAADALDFRWGFEWPTRRQWAGSADDPGQRYGVCWAPADGS